MTLMQALMQGDGVIYTAAIRHAACNAPHLGAFMQRGLLAFLTSMQAAPDCTSSCRFACGLRAKFRCAWRGPPTSRRGREWKELISFSWVDFFWTTLDTLTLHCITPRAHRLRCCVIRGMRHARYHVAGRQALLHCLSFISPAFFSVACRTCMHAHRHTFAERGGERC